MDEDQILDPSSSEGEDIDVGLTDVSTEQSEETEGEPSKRSAEGRITQLIAQNKQTNEELKAMRERMEYMAQAVQPVAAPEPTPVNSPELEKAAALLRQMGFATQEDIEKREQLMRDRLALNDEHNRHESSLDGSDGRPKYDRAKIEGFMQQRGVYDPEAAYKLMYEQELMDWNVKKAEQNQKPRPGVLRPGTGGSSAGNNTITLEKVQQVLQNPNDPKNRAWYERNRMKIMELQAKGQL